MIQQHEKLIYSATEAAAALSVSRPTLYKLLRTGDIPSFSVGTRRLIPRAGLVEWIEKQTGGAA